jgi:hypothetical protein
MPQVLTPGEAWPAVEGDTHADGTGYLQTGPGNADGRGIYWSAPSYQNPSYQDSYPGFTDNGFGRNSGGYPSRNTGGNPARNTSDYANSDYANWGSGGWSQWPASGYRDGNGYDGGDGFDGQADYRDGRGGYRNETGGYRNDADGYREAAVGYREAADGYRDYENFEDYPDYAEPTAAAEHGLRAPDAGLDPDDWQAGRGQPERRGVIVGALTGFLAAAMAIGVSTLAAAFVRPQASPIIAVGQAFIDRTPSALKNFAIQRFGENDKTMLLLGMYVALALIAMAIGLAARRTATLGVAGIAAFGLFGAFVAITRPESRASDVIPSVIGGIAGVAALLWLERACAPVGVTPARRPRASGRRAR